MIADHKRSVFIESKTVSMSLVTLMYRHRCSKRGIRREERQGGRERLETERKIAINFSGGAFLFSPRHIVPIYIYIYIHAVWDSAFARNKSGRGEEREGEEKIRGGGGDRGRLAS